MTMMAAKKKNGIILIYFAFKTLYKCILYCSETYFADRSSLVVTRPDVSPPHVAERRLSTDSIRSTNSNQSNNSDIHQHLHLMFDLLSNTETLKMVS